MKTLAGLAEARQASVSRETLSLYSAHLAEFDAEDVREMIRTVARRKRAEGETAFPSLGDLVEPLERMRSAKRRAEAMKLYHAEDVAYFWSWLPEQMERTGLTEAEVLERFPSFRGTKPDARR